MAVDVIGQHGGWGTCTGCTGNIRATEIGEDVYMFFVPKHDETCTQLQEPTC